MTTPNLDALAKLGPFRCDYPDIRQAYGGCSHLPDVVAALNEWVELRAYRERMEAALRDLCCFSDTFEKDRLKRRGLWRDPAPKEASDGRV